MMITLKRISLRDLRPIGELTNNEVVSMRIEASKEGCYKLALHNETWFPIEHHNGFYRLGEFDENGIYLCCKSSKSWPKYDRGGAFSNLSELKFGNLHPIEKYFIRDFAFVGELPVEVLTEEPNAPWQAISRESTKEDAFSDDKIYRVRGVYWSRDNLPNAAPFGYLSRADRNLYRMLRSKHGFTIEKYELLSGDWRPIDSEEPLTSMDCFRFRTPFGSIVE